MAEEDFGRLFERFKMMLAPYAAKMPVSAARPGMYGVGGDPRWGAAQRAARSARQKSR